MDYVLFGAKWCSGCKSAKQYLEQNNIKFSYVDVDVDFEEAKNQNIRSLPTLLLENGDKVIGLDSIKNQIKS